MARANTPNDPLEPLPLLDDGNSIPTKNRPKFSIGQSIAISRVSYASNGRFYLEQLLKAKGKNITREILDFLNNATGLETSVAGIKAYYAMPTISVCNQCYLADGQCHSGLMWHCKVLVKGVVEGKSLCVIPDVWVAEDCFNAIVEKNQGVE